MPGGTAVLYTSGGRGVFGIIFDDAESQCVLDGSGRKDATPARGFYSRICQRAQRAPGLYARRHAFRRAFDLRAAGSDGQPAILEGVGAPLAYGERSSPFRDWKPRVCRSGGRGQNVSTMAGIGGQQITPPPRESGSYSSPAFLPTGSVGSGIQCRKKKGVISGVVTNGNAMPSRA